jgi:hypothetical protein
MSSLGEEFFFTRTQRHQFAPLFVELGEFWHRR